MPKADTTAPDPLSALDAILAGVAHREVESDERSAHIADANKAFLSDFEAACVKEVRPAMEAVIKRLVHSGGGGVIEEHPGGEARFRNPSVILWMSLEGPIVGDPRADREPYLQLEADVAGHEVHVFEGDMWRGKGGNRSGRIGTWQLENLTQGNVIAELVEIAERSSH